MFKKEHQSVTWFAEILHIEVTFFSYKFKISPAIFFSRVAAFMMKFQFLSLLFCMPYNLKPFLYFYKDRYLVMYFNTLYRAMCLL